MMISLRTAVVGFGFMGKTHAANILRSDVMTLSAIVDRSPDAIGQAMAGNLDTGSFDPKALSSVRQYTDWEECLEKEELDLAYICVHTSKHCEMAMKALRKGLHVFIEKPFVLDVAEGEALIEEARRQQRKIGVAHVVRFMPAYVRLMELYHEEMYGALKFLSLTRFSGIPHWGEWEKRRQDFGSSGGALFDLLIHDIDYVYYLLGKPDRIESRCLPGALSLHDYVSAFWHYEGRDRMVEVEGGNTFHARLPFEAGFRAVFERASVTWSSGNARELYVADDVSLQTIALPDAGEGYRDEGTYFARCILNDTYPETCSAESSLETVRLCHQHIR
ncbi:MAG: Gfo/Idh/MocA family protein [Tannerella sp.]|uniref:Gfo/Idh/MocA family protein n=1 Tax=Tannerella sp. TaxID=2382127 RepID=UPI003FA2CE2D